MFLSNRDIKWAIDCGKLIAVPPPEDMDSGYDETSIDLHLASVNLARVWNIEGLQVEDRTRGRTSPGIAPEVYIGQFDWERFAAQHQIPVPELSHDQAKANEQLVYRRGDEVVVRQFGFVLWPTREWVGTPKVTPEQPAAVRRHPELICFVNGKSTRARTGLLVHFTAPTIHAGWEGTITLEITNLGPFTFVLKENDPLAQLTVATISSAPDLSLKRGRSLTQDQVDPTGRPASPATPTTRAQERPTPNHS